MTAFVDALLARGHEVVVICEQPNHPHGVFQDGFGDVPLKRERVERLDVFRLWVFASPRKSTARRVLFYGTFAAGAFGVAAVLRRIDVVLATSPPLPGALTAALAARMRGIPVVVDIRDLWPAAAGALGELSNPRALAAFEHAERWLYRSAAAVTATTEPFCRHIDAVASSSVCTHIPNGALDELVVLAEQRRPDDGRFRIGYFGNLGIAQGLGIIIRAAKLLEAEAIEFLIVGGGPQEAQLRQQVMEQGLRNIEVRPTVSTDQVGKVMLSCDALLIPLSAHPLLADFIPSKLYDAMAVGRPAIVAANGEAAMFVGRHGFGVTVPPEDGAALASAALRLARDPELAQRLGASGKVASPAHTRSGQAARMCGLLESVSRPRTCQTSDQVQPGVRGIHE
ncbi:MAG: glycosyltransferase family 4 protein [Solirubrobacteraceae bacterium]